MGKKSPKAKSLWSDEVLLTKQIWIFIGITFLIAWPFMVASSLAHLNPQNFTLVMFAPFIAMILTTYFTEKKSAKGLLTSGVKWHFNFRRSWKFYLIAWLIPIICAFVGAVIYFVIYPKNFSLFIFTLQALKFKWEVIPFIVRQCVIICTISVIVAAVPAMGEEAGWRGYLLPRLIHKFGEVKGLILGAIIWGVWQWPILILQSSAVAPLIKLAGSNKIDVTTSGYLYGVDYAGAPWTGMFLVFLYTFAIGTIAWWIYCRSKSIWAASLLHGSVSAVAMFALEFRNPNMTNWILGPSMPGLISILPLLAISIWLIIAKRDEMHIDFMTENLGKH